jgi:hypothetical protein
MRNKNVNKYSALLFVIIFSFLFGDANVQIRLQNGQKSKGEFIGTYMNHVHILVEEKIIYYACDDIISITYADGGFSYGKGYDYDCSKNTVTADILFPPQLDSMTGEMTQMLPDVFNPDIPKSAAKVEDGLKLINKTPKQMKEEMGIKVEAGGVSTEPHPKVNSDLKNDFDKITFKDGNTYLGEFSTIDGDNVFFKPKGASDFHSISIKQIQTLKIKDGQIVIGTEGTYEQLGYEQADEDIQYGKWKNVKNSYFDMGLFTVFTLPVLPLALWSFFVAEKEVRGKMDNLLKNNKSRLNVNFDMMTDEEKALYISGYGKRINEMKTASIFTGCLVDVGVFFVSFIILSTLLPMSA